MRLWTREQIGDEALPPLYRSEAEAREARTRALAAALETEYRDIEPEELLRGAQLSGWLTLRTEDYRILRTRAPEDYDGFGARTVRTEAGGWRLVAVPEPYVEYFRGRCASGLHGTEPAEF